MGHTPDGKCFRLRPLRRSSRSIPLFCQPGGAGREGVSMNLYQEYQRKLRTPEEAVQVVKSGDWVDYTSVLCYPPLLDAALAKRRDELTDVKVRGNLLFGPIQIIECDPVREHFIYNSWHCSAYERRMCDQGRCNYIPMIFRNQPFYYRNFLTVNVAMMAVPPMDKHGYFNFSCAVGVGRSILERADVVILEVNEHLPRICGGFDECIHLSEVDYVVEGPHDPLPQFPVAVPTTEDRAIAEWIVPHISDGATVQLGIGGMPNVVGSLLAQSDVISLHMPLLDSNRHIIDRSAISRMKDGVVIVNCSRGELADIEALIEGIETEKIGALGMDTAEGDEGIIHADHRVDILPNRNWFYLHQFRNVIMTQHMAFYTDAAVASMVRCGIQGICAMDRGQPCPTELTGR